MKKENKKMAQERRARERRKKEIQRKISKTIVILIPLIAVIALFIAIAITSADSASDTDANTDTATNSSTDTDTTADNSTDIDTDNDSAGYSTDASLTVEDGDTVNIDYVGSVDGVEFEGGSTQGQGTDLVEAPRDREQTLSSARAAISMISKNSSSALIPEMKSMCTQLSRIRTITIPISAGKRRCLK